MEYGSDINRYWKPWNNPDENIKETVGTGNPSKTVHIISLLKSSRILRRVLDS